MIIVCNHAVQLFLSPNQPTTQTHTAVYDPQGPLYFVDQIGKRGLGHVHITFDEELHKLVPNTYCDNAKGNPCPFVGFINHRGPHFANDNGLPVTANSDIVGLVGGFGWELNLDGGTPVKLLIDRIEVLPETPLLFTVAYPLGVNVNVTSYAYACRTSPDFSCQETFHRVDTLGEVHHSPGNAYHFDPSTGRVTFRVIMPARKYVGNPEWILPTMETLDRNNEGFALRRFQRGDVILPKVNKGPRLEILTDCTPSTDNPAYCAEAAPTVEPLEVCPDGYTQVGFDRCCADNDDTNCFFAYEQ